MQSHIELRTALLSSAEQMPAASVHIRVFHAFAAAARFRYDILFIERNYFDFCFEKILHFITCQLFYALDIL